MDEIDLIPISEFSYLKYLAYAIIYLDIIKFRKLAIVLRTPKYLICLLVGLSYILSIIFRKL